jgi:hypothetical protein
MSRRRALDRTLTPESRIIGIVSVAILVVGAFVLVTVFSPGERERREVMSRIEIGDEGRRVVTLLGEPTECAARSLEHLRPALPAGWPPPAKEAAIAAMTEETAIRWVYPLDDSDPGDCAGEGEQTEIGLDAERRVLWFVSVTGRTTLELPPRYTPEGDR